MATRAFTDAARVAAVLTSGFESRPKSSEESAMKRFVSVLLAAWMLAGCVAAGTAPGDDGPAVGNPDRTPTLCRNGTPPPCNDRD